MIPSAAASYLDEKAKFLCSSGEWADADQVLIGLPMDLTTSFRPGTRMAPCRIREVSEGIEEYSVYQDRSLEEIVFYDAGDVILPFGNVEQSLERIETVAGAMLTAGKQVFALGGEHLVTLPLVKAYYACYPDLVVVQMDAHADLRTDYLGQQLSHACVMRRVVELIGTKRLFQLGIRSGTREEMIFGAAHSHLYPDQFTDITAEVKAAIGTRPVYITLDIDVLDPAFAPGTGTPEAGGISSRQLLQMLQNLADLQVVGFDLVEICPAYDHGDITSILGAKIIREALLAYR